jgi:hypothetical protein
LPATSRVAKQLREPEPVADEEYLLSFAALKDGLILDCFAGSGMTADAVAA